MRLLTLLKSKIHRATVTDANEDYVGSVTLDRDLMDRTDLHPGELVHIWNANNGARFETYVIEGERGTGQVILNGPAAKLVQVGHIVVIAAFCLTDEPVQPKSILVDEKNRYVRNLEPANGQMI